MNPTRRAMAGALAVLTTAGAFLVASGPVSSEAFPGANGKLAFVKQDPDDPKNLANIWVANGDGTTAVQVTDGREDSFPEWSPDGTRIAFQRHVPAEDEDQVFVMDADGSNQTQLTFATGGGSTPTWSPDGSKIAYSRFVPDDNGPSLWVMGADGSNPVKVIEAEDWDRWPTWSPDGSRIALTRDDPDDGGTQIWVVDVDGSNLVQLTETGSSSIQSFYPTWSPDGSRIAFIRRWSPSDYRIFTIGADGTGETQIAPGPGDNNPAWSPDGTLIAISRFGESTGLWTMAPDGSGMQAIPGTDGAYEPAWQRVVRPVTPATPTTATPATTAAPAAAAEATPRFTG